MWHAKGSIIHKVLINKPTGKRPWGRSRQQWQDRVNTNIRITDGIANIETTIDRDVWRELIKTEKGLNGP